MSRKCHNIEATLVFFEQEDEQRADAEYERAIALDADDPTPYLYRAFNQLSQNKPVAALKDIEASIARNNNRAVYRSSFLLDQDSAVRSTSLAEVFRQLGFSRVSQLEAIKSINHDYGNYSAHRLLADSYEGDFFADARFTEDVLADLLAPVSFNVFSNLNGFSADASLNDYAALFDRPEQRTSLGTSYLSEEDVLQGNVFQTGSTGSFGYFLGYRTLYGNGEKSDGEYDREHRFDIATQYQIDYENRLLINTAFTRSDEYEELSGSTLDDFEVAIGSHHKFNNRSQLINRVEYFDRDGDEFEDELLQTVNESLSVRDEDIELGRNDYFINQQLDDDFRSLRLSSQYIFDGDIVSFVSGAQYLRSDVDSLESSEVIDQGDALLLSDGDLLSSQANFEGDAWSGYTYSSWHLDEWIDAHLGLNFTDIQLPAYDVIPPFVDGTRQESQWSPKLGLNLYPLEHTMLRAAYFESLGISTISDIGSIEPTLVGSFSQSFGDLPGAKTENIGFGIDQKFPEQAYLGAEYLYRDITRDTIDFDRSVILETPVLMETQTLDRMRFDESEHEHLFRSYYYQIVNDRISATLDYSRSELNFNTYSEKRDTDLLRFGLNYFHPNRWYQFGRINWVHQDLENAPGFDDGSDAAWTLDLGIGYRIPRRHGVIQLVLENLFDEDFVYDDRGRERRVADELTARLEASVNF